MTIDSAVESIVRRERAVTVAVLAALVGLAWIYLIRLGREMTSMAEMGMARVATWGPADVTLATAMWAVMMIAMMLPAAAPMILMFVTMNRKRPGGHAVNTGLFTLAYLLAWGGFSALAALAQWGLHSLALLSPWALTAVPVVGGALLVAAGVYQLTPLKYACLARCQSPLGFLMTEWRDGNRGAFVMGIRHGLFCLGCCWALMALLFVGGVMNLAWVAAIAAFVLIEKVVPAGRVVSWASGVALVGWGAWTLGH